MWNLLVFPENVGGGYVEATSYSTFYPPHFTLPHFAPACLYLYIYIYIYKPEARPGLPRIARIRYRDHKIAFFGVHLLLFRDAKFATSTMEL